MFGLDMVVLVCVFGLALLLIMGMIQTLPNFQPLPGVIMATSTQQ